MAQATRNKRRMVDPVMPTRWPLHLNGYKIQDPKPTGGKAGRGRNVRTTIQVMKEGEKVFAVVYYVGMPGAKEKAIQKARKWVNAQGK